MILQDADVPSIVWTGLQWILSIIAIAILGFFLLRWVLKKSFPRTRKIFYFLVPTYIIGAILTTTLGNDKLNEYAVFEFSSTVFYLCPPLVWDAIFAMGIEEGKLSLVLLALFFIIFMPIWVAIKTSAGVDNGEDGKKKLGFIKRLISAWVIVTIMGVGMTNFYTYIFLFIINTVFLGISLIFWIAIAAALIILIYMLVRRWRREHNPENGCQLIDGEWVCPYGQKPPK